MHSAFDDEVGDGVATLQNKRRCGVVHPPNFASVKVRSYSKFSPSSYDEDMTPKHMTVVGVWQFKGVQERCPTKDQGLRLIQF